MDDYTMMSYYCNETRVFNASMAEEVDGVASDASVAAASASSSCLQLIMSSINKTRLTKTAGSSAAASSLIDAWLVFVCVVYGAICLAGIIGNGLVVYVVVRYSKMRSVPNMYLFNLAVSDICFLILLPFLIVTALRKMWVFGEVLCKLFYIMTSLNWFASVFTLIVMSADRYMAVCHPVSSIRYRTSGVSAIVCLSVWVVSTLFMLPICLYAEAVEEQGVKSCTIKWPKNETIAPDKAFIWYAMLIGFAIPMVLICAFYILVILRLKTCGPKKKSGEPMRWSHSHKRVTRMVLAVVTVYFVCWLPYWLFQVILTFQADDYEAPAWQVLAFQFAMILSYTNSVFNPLLYAFLGDNFRQTFARSVACCNRGLATTTPSMRMSDMSCRSNRTTTMRSLRGHPPPAAPAPPHATTDERETHPRVEQQQQQGETAVGAGGAAAFVVRGGSETKMELVLLQVPNNSDVIGGGSFSVTPSSSCAVSIIEEDINGNDDDDADDDYNRRDDYTRCTRRHFDRRLQQQQPQQQQQRDGNDGGQVYENVEQLGIHVTQF